MRTCVLRGPDLVTRLESVSLTRSRIGERRSVVCVSPLKLAPMPSVEMRRSTRVFVPKSKDTKGVKVLRSGRTVCVEPSIEPKITVSEKLRYGRDMINKETSDPMVIDDVCRNKRFGIVYSRKRKRVVSVKKSDKFSTGGRRFGLHFFERKRRKITKTKSFLEKASALDNRAVLYVSSESDGNFALSSVLNSVLRYIWNGKVGIVKLCGFLRSQPVADVFASYGICFLMNDLCNKTFGFCKIYGTTELTPLFDIDYSCVPLCFIHLHANMWLRSLRLGCLLQINDRTNKDYGEPDDTVQCTSISTNTSCCSALAPESSKFECLKLLDAPLGLDVVANWSSERKRKRSMRTRRVRISSYLGSVSPDYGIRENIVRYKSSVSTNHETRKSVQKNSSNTDIKSLKSTLLALGKEMDSVSCSVNLLLIESDRCYRECGACVTLESSTSSEWILSIRIDGSLRYYHKAPKGKEVKPTCTNRFTLAIIWCVEAEWKLEFTERREWAIFKELFKICGDRNIVIPSPATAIPIPGVYEASICDISHDNTPYVREESYIKVNGDELTRALLRSSAIYDMDSEDEEWLSTFNTKLDLENDLSVHVVDNSFELMIDRFEKAAFRQPDDFAGIKATVRDLCLDLASIEVVEAVYNYWMMKRKQKHGSLLRVLQLNEPKKIPVISKSISRKKRSMKQQPRHSHQSIIAPSGRGKGISVLKAIAAKQTANEEKIAMLEVEQATAAAKTALSVALWKRKRVQSLMENADLAVYRATKAIRIAEAAQLTETDQAAAHFLD